MNALWEWLYDASGASIYYQHAICLTNDPVIMTLYVASDLTIFLSYTLIGVSLLIHSRHTIRLSTRALGLYGAFIFLCGITHLTKTVTLFSGIYRVDVLVVAATAAVSAMTAALTVRETLMAD
jgi:hypothetical protein